MAAVVVVVVDASFFHCFINIIILPLCEQFASQELHYLPLKESIHGIIFNVYFMVWSHGRCVANIIAYSYAHTYGTYCTCVRFTCMQCQCIMWVQFDMLEKRLDHNDFQPSVGHQFCWTQHPFPILCGNKWCTHCTRVCASVWHIDCCPFMRFTNFYIFTNIVTLHFWQVLNINVFQIYRWGSYSTRGTFQIVRMIEANVTLSFIPVYFRR